MKPIRESAASAALTTWAPCGVVAFETTSISAALQALALSLPSVIANA
nr:hypothetical protein [Sorangium cellulosum]